jgi:serine/threonine protein kinase
VISENILSLPSLSLPLTHSHTHIGTGSSSLYSKRRKKKNIFSDTEIRVLMRTRHRRLVLFLGCGYDPQGNHFVVLEYMDALSLDTRLWEQDKSKFKCTWLQRYQFLLDTAEGLCYLHYCAKSIHRDVKSPNIMLSSSSVRAGSLVPDGRPRIRAKLGDFGLAKVKVRILHSKEETKEEGSSARDIIRVVGSVSKGFVGTPEWMPPEMMCTTVTAVGHSIDVYAFGIVMWECMLLEKPWRALKAHGGSHAIFRAVRSGQRPKLPLLNEDISEEYVSLMRQCWDQKPSLRPTSIKIYKKLLDIASKALNLPPSASSSILATFEKEDYSSTRGRRRRSSISSKRRRGSSSLLGEKPRTPSKDPSHTLVIHSHENPKSKTHRHRFADLVHEFSKS